MNYTKIIEKSFDESGKALVTDSGGRNLKDDKNFLNKFMKPGEWVFTKSNGETITMGQDEETPGEYFVTGRLPKSYKRFNSFDDTFKYWEKTYRK